MNEEDGLLDETKVQGPFREVARQTFMGIEPVLLQLNWNALATKADGAAIGRKTCVARSP